MTGLDPNANIFQAAIITLRYPKDLPSSNETPVGCAGWKNSQEIKYEDVTA
jgi:hypothetical protein